MRKALRLSVIMVLVIGIIIVNGVGSDIAEADTNTEFDLNMVNVLPSFTYENGSWWCQESISFNYADDTVNYAFGFVMYGNDKGVDFAPELYCSAFTSEGEEQILHEIKSLQMITSNEFYSLNFALEELQKGSDGYYVYLGKKERELFDEIISADSLTIKIESEKGSITVDCNDESRSCLRNFAIVVAANNIWDYTYQEGETTIEEWEEAYPLIVNMIPHTEESTDNKDTAKNTQKEDRKTEQNQLWEQAFSLDEFGDSTEETMLETKKDMPIAGYYTNSLGKTIDSNTTMEIHDAYIFIKTIDKKYGALWKNSYSLHSDYTISIKDKNGEVHSFMGEMTDTDTGIYVKGEKDYKGFISLIEENAPLKCLIYNNFTPDQKLSFTIQNDDSFKEMYESVIGDYEDNPRDSNGVDLYKWSDENFAALSLILLERSIKDPYSLKINEIIVGTNSYENSYGSMKNVPSIKIICHANNSYGNSVIGEYYVMQWSYKQDMSTAFPVLKHTVIPDDDYLVLGTDYEGFDSRFVGNHALDISIVQKYVDAYKEAGINR